MVAWSGGRGVGGWVEEEDKKEGHMRGIVQEEEGEVYCVWVEEGEV